MENYNISKDNPVDIPTDLKNNRKFVDYSNIKINPALLFILYAIHIKICLVKKNCLWKQNNIDKFPKKFILIYEMSEN
jgi:hypothetical protein